MDSSLFSRALPSSFVALSSKEGRENFAEALEAGTMASFFPLLENLHVHAEPAFCGTSSLLVVLRALGLLRGSLPAGPWRWVGDDRADCCSAVDDESKEPFTLAQAATIARSCGARVKMFPSEDTAVMELRYYVRAACRAASGNHVMAAYPRPGSSAKRGAHACPIAGYNATCDMVLMLDVARRRYPPHWMPLAALWEAMARAGEEQGPGASAPYGYLVLMSGDAAEPGA